MTFIFTPGKQGITLLSPSTSPKARLANLCPGKSPGYLGVLGQLRMFHRICLVAHIHMLSLFPLALARIFSSNTGGNLIPRTEFLLTIMKSKIPKFQKTTFQTAKAFFFLNLYISSSPDLELIYCNQEVTVK